MTYTTKKITTFFLCYILIANAFAQSTGKIIEQQSIKSTILSKDVKYSIYLPPNYENATQLYPVVYLLHGYGGNNNSWIKTGNVNEYADKAIANNTIPAVIIVMPNADSSFYINAYNHKINYEDFFINEFIPAIEKTYRVKAEKKYRAIAGLSMGGYGALLYTLKYPNIFSAAAALSAAILDDNDYMNMPAPQWNQLFSQSYGVNLMGKDRLDKTWHSNSILKIVDTKTADELKAAHYWIDCGDDDFLTKGNCLLHIALADKKVAHEYRVRDGSHNWNYWRSGITDALQFITTGFKL
jgi:S-formylglutathione hydrolase FrmB